MLSRAAQNDAIPPAYRDHWRERPQLPATHGACWVIFAADRPFPLPSMRPAFVLPLRWQQGQEHSPRLPKALTQLGETVVRACAEHVGNDGRHWGLQPAEILGELDLSEMPMECRSGWASLAAGLLVAAQGGTPDPEVWATAGWDDSAGFMPVDLLKPKLDLAAELGARVSQTPDLAVCRLPGRAVVLKRSWQRIRSGGSSSSATRGSRTPRSTPRLRGSTGGRWLVCSFAR